MQKTDAAGWASAPETVCLLFLLRFEKCGKKIILVIKLPGQCMDAAELESSGGKAGNGGKKGEMTEIGKKGENYRNGLTFFIAIFTIWFYPKVI